MDIAIKTKDFAIFAIVAVFAFFANIAPTLASAITSERMVDLTNEARIAAGLSGLTVSDKLQYAARAKADDMLAKQYFEHTSPEGLTPWHWFDLAGYEYVYAAENLAIDFVTAEGAHSALMRSTGHKENILGKNYEEIGIAIANGEFEGRDTIIIVEEFGSAREPKITVNNLPFFERTEEAKVATETVSGGNGQSLPSVQRIEVSKPAEIQTVVSQESDVAHDAVASLDELEAAKEDVSDDPSTGQSIAKVYSVRRMAELKKAYSEGIYWERADEGSIMTSLGKGTDRIKLFLAEMINGLLLPVLHDC